MGKVIQFPGRQHKRNAPRFSDAGALYQTLIDEFWLPGGRVEVNIQQGALQVCMPEPLILPDLPRQFNGFPINYVTM